MGVREMSISEEDMVPIEPKINEVVKELRLGSFFIPVVVINRMPWDEMMDFMNNFLVIKCEMLPGSKMLQYNAFSSMFEPVPVIGGKKAPIYDILINEQEDGNRKYEAKKRVITRIIEPGGSS
jgi:hypothetical protein